MFCIKCGHPLKTNFRFCPKCGAKQPDVVVQHLSANNGEYPKGMQGTEQAVVEVNNSSVAEAAVMTAPKLSVSVRYKLDGRTAATTLVLPCVIGRNHGCQLYLTDEKVSQQHAKVSLENNAVMIEDLGSLNGTYVNGEKIEGPVELLSGDEVVVGMTNLFFVVSVSDGADAT